MSRGTRESSEESDNVFAYGAVTLYRPIFQPGSANAPICNSSTCSQRSHRIPQPRARKTPCAATPHAVWAVPRSLAATRGVAILLSRPSGTEMVHFPEFASVAYVFNNGW